MLLTDIQTLNEVAPLGQGSWVGRCGEESQSCGPGCLQGCSVLMSFLGTPLPLLLHIQRPPWTTNSLIALGVATAEYLLPSQVPLLGQMPLGPSP